MSWWLISLIALGLGYVLGLAHVSSMASARCSTCEWVDAARELAEKNLAMRRAARQRERVSLQ